MLKQLIIIALSFCLANVSNAQVPDESEIKNLKIRMIGVRSIEGDIGDTILSAYYYDEHGNDTAYYQDGKLVSYKTIIYNKEGQILNITRFFRGGKEMDKTIFTYKTGGTYSSVNTDKEFGMKVTETYDMKGRILSRTIPDGTIIKYLYNARGQLTSDYSIPAKGEKKVASTYTYDAKGKRVSSLTRGDRISRSTYEYGEKGLLKKEVSTTIGNANEKIVSTTEYKYGY